MPEFYSMTSVRFFSKFGGWGARAPLAVRLLSLCRNYFIFNFIGVLLLLFFRRMMKYR